MKSAIELISLERRRQIEVEVFTPEHDDTEHSCGELAMAAMCYMLDTVWRPAQMAPLGWPWLGHGGMDGFKPTPEDRIRELVKGCALAVAEIERLQRIEQKIEQSKIDDEKIANGDLSRCYNCKKSPT